MIVEENCNAFVVIATLQRLKTKHHSDLTLVQCPAFFLGCDAHFLASNELSNIFMVGLMPGHVGRDRVGKRL